MKRFLAAMVVVVAIFVAASPAAYAGIPGLGPVRTNLLLQNAGTADARLDLVWATGAAGGLSRRYEVESTLAPRGVRYLLSTEADGSVTDSSAGAGAVYSSQPLRGLVEMLWDYSSGTRAPAMHLGTGDGATRCTSLPIPRPA